MACDDAADKMGDRMALQHALLPVISIPQLKSFVTEIQNNLDKKIAFRGIDMATLDALNKTLSSNSLFRLYTAMERSGIIRPAEPTDENMDTDDFRDKMHRDMAAGIIKPWGGIGKDQ